MILLNATIPTDIPQYKQIADVIWLIITAVIGGSGLIQLSPIKLDPWTWALKRIGKVANEDIEKKVDEVSNKVTDLEERVISHEDQREEDKAISARRRILAFADECIMSNVCHSREHYNDVMEDITYYKNYCAEHTDFKNERCMMSIETIEESYRKCYMQKGEVA